MGTFALTVGPAGGAFAVQGVTSQWADEASAGVYDSDYAKGANQPDYNSGTRGLINDHAALTTNTEIITFNWDLTNIVLDGGSPINFQNLPAGFTITDVTITFRWGLNASDSATKAVYSRLGGVGSTYESTVFTNPLNTAGANSYTWNSNPFGSTILFFLGGMGFRVDNTNVGTRSSGLFTNVVITGHYSIVASSYNNPTVGMVRQFDAQNDRQVASFPSDPTQNNLPAVPVSVYGNGGTLYVAVHTSGQGGNAVGRVYTVDVATGYKQQLGTAFPTGQMPYSFLWAYGRLWCGTVFNQTGGPTSGLVRWIRPGVDSDWTTDNTFGSGLNGVTGLALFQGQIYASLLYSGTADGNAVVAVRSTLGSWSNSDSVDAGALSTGLGRGYYGLIVWPDPTFQGTPAPALYAVRTAIPGDTASVVRQLTTTGGSWASVYTGALTFYGLASMSAQNAAGKVIPVLWSANGDTGLINTIDGSSWVSRASVLGNARSTMATAGIFRKPKT